MHRIACDGQRGKFMPMETQPARRAAEAATPMARLVEVQRSVGKISIGPIAQLGRRGEEALADKTAQYAKGMIVIAAKPAA
jgi:hypothetical protein